MSRQLRIFLDSNVLISALIGAPDSAPVVLVDWLASGQPARLLTSRRNVAEVERNIRTRLPAALPLWQDFVTRSGVSIVAGTHAHQPGINAKDAAIVAAAVRSKATYFVTGDKQLRAEIDKTLARKLTAVTPREMLELLLTL